MVEHSTADREVHGSTPCAPFSFSFLFLISAILHPTLFLDIFFKSFKIKSLRSREFNFSVKSGCQICIIKSSWIRSAYPKLYLLSKGAFVSSVKRLKIISGSCWIINLSKITSLRYFCRFYEFLLINSNVFCRHFRYSLLSVNIQREAKQKQ